MVSGSRRNDNLLILELELVVAFLYNLLVTRDYNGMVSR